MKRLISLLTALLFTTCGAATNGLRFEQASLNPYTDSCDYVQRNDPGQVQVVCTVVTHVR